MADMRDILTPKHVAGFILRSVAIYTVLMMPWPGLREGYAALFRGSCKVFTGPVGSHGYVSLLKKTGDPERDIGFGLTNVTRSWTITTEDISKNSGHRLLLRRMERRGLRAGDFVEVAAVSSRLIGYLPTALVLALVLSTPRPWRKKGRAVFWALVLTHGFIGVRMTIAVYSEFARNDKVALVQVGDAIKGLLLFVEFLLTEHILPSIVVPFVIWILVSFPQDDWSILGAKASMSGRS